jgi:hypothetical protein
MDSMNPFEEAGFRDPLLGAEVFRLLDIGDAILSDSIEVTKLKEVGEFVSHFHDGAYVLQKALRRNPGMKPLDAALGFVKLRKEYMDVNKKKQELEKELSFYE